MTRTCGRPLGLLLAIGLIVPVANAQGKGPTCRSAADCNAKGTDALRKGNVDGAIELFRQQAVYAEKTAVDLQQKDRPPADPYREAEKAYDNLAVAYLHKHDPLRSRAWSKQALSWNAQDHAAQFNLAQAEAALKGWHWPATPEGAYLRYGGNGEWSQLIVESAREGRIRFCFEGINAGPATADSGEVQATVRLRKALATWSTREYGGRCVITMRFQPDRIAVKQKGSDLACGFGNGVTADGTFQRVSTRAKCPKPEGE